MQSAARSSRFFLWTLVALLSSTVPCRSATREPRLAREVEPCVDSERPPREANPYADAEHLLHDKKFAEAADAFAKLAASNPYDGYLWGNWGFCLHSIKRYDEAIPRFAKAVELDRDPATYLYDIACAQSLMGHKDEAFAWLEKALDARFVDQSALENDTDLDSLRSDPRFASLTGITRSLAAPPAHSRDEGWQWDLAFYARRMKQMHWNLYGKISETAFKAELDRLAREIPKLTDDQARARLRKITALVGDGHTSVPFGAEGAATQPRVPLHLYAFKEGLYVIGASSEHQEMLGARVLKVGSLDADAALAAVRPFISVDNEMGYANAAPEHLLVPVVLREIGAAADERGADFTIGTPDAKTATVHVAAVAAPTARHAGFFRPELVYLNQSSGQALPLYLRDQSHNLRLEPDLDHKLVYFRFGAIADDADLTIADASRQLFELVEKNGAEHVVIDMRYNGGGNTGLIQPLIDGILSSKTINRMGHLWVIIGRRTFSAAQNTVNMISSFAHPIFVGEPTGSRPRFVGESTWFVLPHSRTRVYCSSRYWQVLDSTDNRCWIPPQIVAEPTFADYAAGRDRALEAVYAAIGAATDDETTHAEPR